MLYDGVDRIAEYDGSSNLQRRYVHGLGIDDPLVWYEGTGTADRRFLSSDERGSIISLTDSSGSLLGINRYDEFGIPQVTNLGAFGYTGQTRIPQIKVWYYKARAYLDEAGRFMQIDPAGYADTPNLYAYVLNNPIGLIDPAGTQVTNPLSDPGFWIGGGRNITGHRETVETDPVTGEQTLVETFTTSTSEGLNDYLRSQSSPTSPSVVFNRGNLIALAARMAGPLLERAALEEARRREAEYVQKQAVRDWCGSSEFNAPEGNWAQACQVHDACYAQRGGLFGKTSCDLQLAGNIIAACTEKLWVPAVCVAPALLGWVGVTALGSGPYCRAQRRRGC